MAVKAMANARLYGSKTAFTPNSKADRRFRKNIWQHNREIAEREPTRKRERKEMVVNRASGSQARNEKAWLPVLH
jgi:hypothetical protein